MSVWIYIFGMIICSVSAISALVSILIAIDPYQTNILIKTVFFLCLFFSLTSLFSLLAFFLKKKQKILFKRASISFWQSAVLAGIIIISYLIWRL